MCDTNLENATFTEKKDLITKRGITVYTSDNHKVVRVVSKLQPCISNCKLSIQIISIASPILIIPREYAATQAYLEVSVA